MKKTLAALGVLIFLAALSCGAWYALARWSGRGGPNAGLAAGPGDISSAAAGFASADPGEEVLPAGPLAPPRQAPQGEHEYRNEQYRFALFSPDDLESKSYDEGGGAATFVFQDVAAARGFQIFVVPYADQQISKQRFAEDEPSGVMQNPLNVTIGGVKATSFFGSDPALGPTAEIWFLHGGYLFEVTAPKSEAAWLSGIMETWEFI